MKGHKGDRGDNRSFAALGFLGLSGDRAAQGFMVVASHSDFKIKSIYYKFSLNGDLVLCDPGSAVLGGGADCGIRDRTLHRSCPFHYEVTRLPACGELEGNNFGKLRGKYHQLGWHGRCDDGQGNWVAPGSVWVICIRP